MKIAVIRRIYSSTGGAELYTERLLRALTGRGNEVHLFAEQWSDNSFGCQIHSVHVAALRARRPLEFARAVQQILPRHNFNCVFSLDRTLSQDVYRAGDGVHAAWLERRRQFASWWRRPWVGGGAFHRGMLALERQTFSPQCTGRIIVNSRMVREEIQERFGFPVERIDLVRNGIELPRFQNGKRDATRERLGIGPDEFVILFAGSGWERKGLPFLLRAFRLVRKRRRDAGLKFRLLIAGKGRPSFAQRFVHFVGPVRDLENFYAAADLFVLLPIYEPSANVCIEAMSAGLPVITTRYNGASELITAGRNGSIISNPADAREVTDAILHWHSRWQPGRPSRLPLPDGLDLDRNVDETLAVLERAVREKAR